MSVTDMIVRHGKGARFSRVVVHDRVAYFSGLTADDRAGDIQAQTRGVLAKTDAMLAEIGANRSQILSATIWLADIADFAGMNAAWEAWIDTDHPPARATVESKLALPDLRVEIQFIVAIR